MTAVASTTSSALDRLRTHRAAIYAAGTVVGRSGALENIWPTGMTEPAADFLRDLIIRERSRRTLEVGLGVGLSSLAILEGLLTNGGDVHHTTIDYAQDRRDFAGVQTLADAGIDALTTFIAKPSSIALANLVESGERFDVAFIDGGHHFDAVLVDLFFALQLVKPEGLIVLDDHWMPAVQTALAFCTTNWDVQLELFDPRGPGARLVAFRNNGKANLRPWDHFAPFGRGDLPTYPWRK